MAGDIFFTDDAAWSANSIGFCDMMQRAIRKCTANETELIKIFSEADQIRCLGINLCSDRELQAILTRRILDAANEMMLEVESNPNRLGWDKNAIQNLIALAQLHLARAASDEAI